MKKLLFLFALTAFCFVSKAQVKVGADKSFQAHFDKYSTYAWSSDIDQIPGDKIFAGINGVLIFNNESTRAKIKDAIRYELDARGYKYQQSNGDIFITFKVTEQPGTLTTFNGYEMIENGLDSTRTKDNLERIKVDAGTVFINIIDAKSGKVAWQGYASGILKPDMVNDESKVRQAVSDLFKEFKYRAPAK